MRRLLLLSLLPLLLPAAAAADTVNLSVAGPSVVGGTQTALASGVADPDSRLIAWVKEIGKPCSARPIPALILDTPVSGSYAKLPSGAFGVPVKTPAPTVCAELQGAAPARKRVTGDSLLLVTRQPKVTLTPKLTQSARPIIGSPVAGTVRGSIETTGALRQAVLATCPIRPPAEATSTPVAGAFDVPVGGVVPFARTFKACAWLQGADGTVLSRKGSLARTVVRPRGSLTVRKKAAGTRVRVRSPFTVVLTTVTELPSTAVAWVTRESSCGSVPRGAAALPVDAGTTVREARLRAPLTRGRFRICARLARGVEAPTVGRTLNAVKRPRR